MSNPTPLARVPSPIAALCLLASAVGGAPASTGAQANLANAQLEATAQASGAAAESTGAEDRSPARLVRPGARATGRWIVHLARDAAAHRHALKSIGELRRARLDDELRARVELARSEVAERAAPIAELARAHGARVLHTNWLTESLVLDSADEDLLAALLAHDRVELVQGDEWREPQLGTATDAAHHDSDGANQLVAPGGTPVTGAGITIAVVDSSIDLDHAGSGRPHAAFFPGGDPTNTTGGGIGGSRILSAVNSSAFFPGQQIEDICGHGTRVAAIAAGAAFNALPDVDDAPAPSAHLRVYKISDDSVGGGGCLASFVSMDQAFADLVADPDVSVAVMAYDGTPDPLLSPNRAIADAVLADVLVTLSAGNFGGALGFAHGSYNALSVGASFAATQEPLAIPGLSTSAIGPLDGRVYPQLLAVGDALTTAELDDETASIDSTGTSGAAALTAGTAALVRQARPSLSALEVRALLLNTCEPVVLGDPNAAGYGYLRSKRAVEDALAGLVVEQFVATGETRRHTRFLLDGEAATFTLSWLRESSNDTTIDDLDLRVRDPKGQLIAWSASQSDNTEQIRITAAEQGLYRIEVIPISFDGDGTAEYALAGVDTPAFDPGTCAPGVPTIAQHSPPSVPTITQAFEWTGMTNQVTLSGCNLASVSTATIGSKTVPVTVVDDNTLTFDLGVAPAVGNVPIQLNGSAGTGNGTLRIVPVRRLATTPTIDLGKMSALLAGPPNHVYAFVYSPDLAPTVMPGVASLDIGNAGQSLLLLDVGVLPAANGVRTYLFSNISGTAGENFHFQGATIDPVTFALPWTSTNPSTVLFFL